MRLIEKHLNLKNSQPQSLLIKQQQQSKQYPRFPSKQRIDYRMAKRQTFGSVFTASQQPNSTQIDDKQLSLKCSSRISSIYKRDLQFKEPAKILTLQQIKKFPEPALNERESNAGKMKTSRKIFVSISKGNKALQSKQMKLKPSLSQIGGDYAFLRSLSNKTSIIETVELQMNDSIQRSIFICR